MTVKHYESNPVSLSEDDDKKIRAAERQGLRDQARQRKKRNVEGFAFRNRQAQPFFSPYSRQFNGSQRSWQFSQPFTSSSTNQHFSTTNREFTRGPCRYCGSSGHWWKECPVRLARFHIGCSSSQLPASSTGTVITVPENSFMASLQQEASGALGVHYSASHSGLKARDVNARLEEEFADLLSQDKYCFDSEYQQCLSSRGFEYKQGSAPIVYKDRLKSKVDLWVSIGSSLGFFLSSVSGIAFLLFHGLLELFSVTIGLP